MACYLLAGIWLLWLYAEPRVIPAIAARVEEHLPERLTVAQAEAGPVSRGEARQALQLTLGELRTNSARFNASLKTGQYPQAVTLAWDRNGATLAAYPGSEDAYDAAQEAYRWIADFRDRRIGARVSKSLAMGGKSKNELPKAVDQIDLAVVEMERYRDDLKG